ncbi:MAG: hypothetical protein EDX89_05280 [Acidobacteria bacterium]|nr:MAG: hypothetical protein EDX89_05280 [Acidobacteriota bacterium]
MTSGTAQRRTANGRTRRPGDRSRTAETRLARRGRARRGFASWTPARKSAGYERYPRPSKSSGSSATLRAAR